MNTLKKIAAASALLLGVAAGANAGPILQIVGSGGGALDPANHEAIGDAGGTRYSYGATTGASNGPGMPTVLGGWPATSSFGQDPSYNLGISGYDASYLKLTEAATVKFEFMGKGDATDQNIFQVYLSAVWVTIWDNKSTVNGTCGVIGTTPYCPYTGSTASYFFEAGLIPFQFVNVSQNTTAINDGFNNAKPDKIGDQNGEGPGFFLGIDPYLTTSQGATRGRAAYIGFTDSPCIVDGACDHDYQDLLVRVSVPEPGSL